MHGLLEGLEDQYSAQQQVAEPSNEDTCVQ